jgi:hypothetical protein
LSIAIGFELAGPTAEAMASLREHLSRVARSRGWAVQVDPDDVLVVRPSERCEPIRLPAAVEDGLIVSVKTQLAGPAVHLEIRDLFSALASLAPDLEVVDDVEGIVGPDLAAAFRDSRQLVLQRARQVGGKAFVWLPDGSLADVVATADSQRRANRNQIFYSLKAVGLLVLAFGLLIGGIFAWAWHRGLL